MWSPCITGVGVVDQGIIGHLPEGPGDSGHTGETPLVQESQDLTHHTPGNPPVQKLQVTEEMVIVAKLNSCYRVKGRGMLKTGLIVDTQK